MADITQGLRLLGRYRLLERLGGGGHAEVWAAEDEHADNRVALKFMHLEASSAEEAMLVLRHEAQMARRLNHPGVLHVDEPLRDGQLVFLPMEYAGGGDVAQLRGAPWRQVLPVLMQVARVLEHAHSRGVVHRDIKPGNVLLDASGVVRVADFGTATRTGSTRAMSAGTPFYASPQQLRGQAATTADDVYGLGALAHSLLTHHAPAELRDLVQAMLAPDSAVRPDIGQVMESFGQMLESTAPTSVILSPRWRSRPRMTMALMAFIALLLLLRGVSGLREHRNADDLDRGAMLESIEQWRQAVIHYQAVVARDGSLQFAQDGLVRSKRRVALDEELALYVSQPQELVDPVQRNQALRTLARAEATIPRTTRLAAQIGQLSAALRLPP